MLGILFLLDCFDQFIIRKYDHLHIQSINMYLDKLQSSSTIKFIHLPLWACLLAIVGDGGRSWSAAELKK